MNVTKAPFSSINILDIGHEIQLAGAIYTGNGKMYLMLYPNETLDDTKIDAVEMTTENWLEVIRQSDLLETEVLAKSPDGTIGKAIIRKSTRQIEQQVSFSVYRRDGFACRYCGANNVPLTVDHLVCWEQGGPSIPANLTTSCRFCNRIRGNTPYADWLRHSHYLKVSRKLTQAQRDANEALVATLDKIPLKIHIVNR